MNMERLKRSRQFPEPGDIFVFRFKGRDFGFGRVIRNNAIMGGYSGALLVYIYKATSPAMDNIPALDKFALLLPPLGIGRSPWTTGYFQTVRHEQLSEADVLEYHTFDDEILGRQCDEFGRTVRFRKPHMGPWVVGNHITTDVMLSMALGIKPHPDTVAEPKKPRLVR